MNFYTKMARFKGAVRDGHAPVAGIALRKAATLTVAAAGGERRKLFTISTPRVDRENDTVAVSGWDFEAYMRNPIVLWGHDLWLPPIGRSVEIGVDDGALKAVVEFVPSDMPGVGERAEMVLRMCEGGFLSAASVGFRPLEYTKAKDRQTDDDWWPPLDFQRQELLEWSVVTIPANPDATMERDDPAALQPLPSPELIPFDIGRAAATAAQRRHLRARCY